MSRRDDYVGAVVAYLAKRVDLTADETLRVLERVLMLEHERFPGVRASDVLAFVAHALDPEFAEAPPWLAAAEEVSDRPPAPKVSVEYVQNDPDAEWVQNALDLWSEDQTPATTHALFPGSGWVEEVPEEDFEALVAWASTIPGYDPENPPFVRHVPEAG